jgi:hypothetical protein
VPARIETVGIPEFWAYDTAALTSENWAAVGATVTTELPPVTVLLVEATEDPVVDDTLVEREASVPELKGVEDDVPDELPAEMEEMEVADNVELAGELIAPAFWPKSEL